jgi:membrane protein
MPDSDGARATSEDRGLVHRARDAVVWFFDEVPAARRALTELTRVEFIDRSMVIAAQALFSVTPLLVVVAAFAPNGFSSTALDTVTSAMGIESGDATALNTAATAENVRAQTGVIGAILVLISALSFARAIQRLYERVWEKPHRGGLVGNRRCLFWLVAWLIYVQLLAAMFHAISDSGYSLVRVFVQIAANAALWWWTAHTLLLGRVPWRSLWLGAFLTAVGVNVMIQISDVVMPAYVKSSVEQFGGIGLMLAASTWLFVLGGVIVLATVLGRVLIEEPRLRAPLDWLKQFRARQWRTHRSTRGIGEPRD